jgi:hypothetical protein
MEGLTKENFFNERSDLYPLAHHVFLTWIDEEKKKLDWNELFSYNIPVSYHHEAPKFHQIPFELQFGILARFITIGMRDPLYNFQFDIELFKRQMKVVYEKIERGINNGKLDKK